MGNRALKWISFRENYLGNIQKSTLVIGEFKMVWLLCKKRCK